MIPYALIFLAALLTACGWYLYDQWKNAPEDPHDDYPKDASMPRIEVRKEIL